MSWGTGKLGLCGEVLGAREVSARKVTEEQCSVLPRDHPSTVSMLSDKIIGSSSDSCSSLASLLQSQGDGGARFLGGVGWMSRFGRRSRPVEKLHSDSPAYGS